MIRFEEKHFDVTFTDEAPFTCTMDEGADFRVDFGAAVEKEYRGAYSVTPSTEEQTLPTANRVLAQNVTIAPIPQNYGLITWNGAELTVS